MYFTILVNWVANDVHRKNLRKKAIRKQKLLKSQAESSDESYEQYSPTSFVYRACKSWAYFALSSLALVLWKKNSEYGSNFMSRLCIDKDEGCDQIVERAIIIHVITSFALLVASRTVR